jgi:hypothetical protein
MVIILAAITTGCGHDAHVLKAGGSVKYHDDES